MEKKIAKVNNVFLGWEDHGILTVMIDLDYGGSAQGAGGYALDAYDKQKKDRVGTAFGLEFIMRTMQAFGVRDWSKIKGRTIYALIGENDMVRGFELLPTEGGISFYFDELTGKYKD